MNADAVPGILSSQGGELHYKEGLGEGKYAPSVILAEKPSPGNVGIAQQLDDLEGDGSLCLVQYTKPLQGYFERKGNGGWKNCISFKFLPNIDWNDPNFRQRMMDTARNMGFRLELVQARDGAGMAGGQGGVANQAQGGFMGMTQGGRLGMGGIGMGPGGGIPGGGPGFVGMVGGRGMRGALFQQSKIQGSVSINYGNSGLISRT